MIDAIQMPFRTPIERMPTELFAVKEKRDLVDRVANSPVFQRSPRLREFLLYVADCTIDERLEGVREQQIAENVFHRKPDYNPGQDNIVRVEARSLRKRLDAYFAAEGKDEPIVLSMPKGSYAIFFEPRPPEFEDRAPVEIPDLAEAAVPIPSTNSHWLVGVLLAIIIALAGLVAVQWQTARTGKDNLRSPPALILPFSALSEDTTKDTYIITSDTALLLIQDLRRRQVTLDDYITGRYMADTSAPGLDPASQDLIRMLLTRRYTNAAETAIAGRIMQLNGGPQRILLRSGHGVQLSDFKNRNIILLGSPRSNPWVRLFSETLNFQFDWDQARRGMFRNRSPRAGEQSVYSMTTNSGESGAAYAVVAFVPNVNGEGHVLLIGGTTAEGTEAAGEFITDGIRASAALKAMGINPAGPPRHFEILLKATAVAGSASQSTILASRLIPDTK